MVDKVGDALPMWKASLLPKSSRQVLIQSVLCAIPVHSMLALDLPAKTISALSKICRGFLWCGKKEARGGNCSVSWEMVQAQVGRRAGNSELEVAQQSSPREMAMAAKV